MSQPGKHARPRECCTSNLNLGPQRPRAKSPYPNSRKVRVSDVGEHVAVAYWLKLDAQCPPETRDC